MHIFSSCIKIRVFECVPWSGWLNLKTWCLPMMTLAPVFSSVSSVICLPFTYTTALSMGSKVTFPVKSQSHYVTFFQQGKKNLQKLPKMIYTCMYMNITHPFKYKKLTKLQLYITLIWKLPTVLFNAVNFAEDKAKNED